MARSSFLLTDETRNILDNLKEGGGIKRDKAIELSILYADKNKEDFAAFVGQKTTNNIKNSEKKGE